MASEARWTAVCVEKRMISRFGSISREPHRPPRARQVFGLVKIICKTGDAFSASFRGPVDESNQLSRTLPIRVFTSDGTVVFVACSI